MKGDGRMPFALTKARAIARMSCGKSDRRRARHPVGRTVREQERGTKMDIREARQTKVDEETKSPSIWSALSLLALAMAAGGITARLQGGPRFDWLLLMTAMGLTAAVLMRLLADDAAQRDAAARYAADPLKDMLDSAGTIVIAIAPDGKITYVNPAAERLLGYHAAELVNQETTKEILAPGEEERLVSEVRRLFGMQRNPETVNG